MERVFNENAFSSQFSSKFSFQFAYFTITVEYTSVLVFRFKLPDIAQGIQKHIIQKKRSFKRF